VIGNIIAFVVAAALEIAGCFAFWVCLRRGQSVAVAMLGIVSLCGFAFALTRVDSAFAGRAYAAYGGIYIAASLIWLWIIERPTADCYRSCGGCSGHRRCISHHWVRTQGLIANGTP
jgi:small multidrug resistance family-3 protein